VGQERGEVVESKEVLSAQEAAVFLGFRVYTIREKAAKGEIPGRKVGKEWRFSRRRLLEWLEEGDREQIHA
jgi:excisionase family DNA binding protein